MIKPSIPTFAGPLRRYALAGVCVFVVALLPAPARTQEANQSRVWQILEESGGNEEGIQAAARRLETMSAGGRTVFPALFRAINTSDRPELKTWGLLVLERLGKLLGFEDLFVDLLKSGNRKVRIMAAQFLTKDTKWPDSVVPALCEAVGDPDPEVRVSAVRALVAVRTQPLLIESALQRAIKDSDASVRRASADALGAGIEFELDVPALAMALKSDPVEPVRAAAAASLGRIGRMATTAVPALVSALDDPSGPVRQAAATSLPGFGLLSSEGIQALGKRLDDPEVIVRAASMASLGQVKEQALPVAPSIARALLDMDPGVRAGALKLLGSFGEKASVVVPELADELSSLSPESRRCAVRALGAIGPKAVDAIPQLAGVLERSDQALQDETVGILASLLMCGDPRVPGIVVACGYPDVRLRFTALRSLIAPQAGKPTAGSALARAWLNPDRSIRLAAVRTIAALQYPTSDEGAVLLAAIRTNDGEVQRATLGGIAKQRSLASIALPQLVALIDKDANPSTDAAATAIVALATLVQSQVLGSGYVMSPEHLRLWHDADRQLRRRGAAARQEVPIFDVPWLAVTRTLGVIENGRVRGAA